MSNHPTAEDYMGDLHSDDYCVVCGTSPSAETETSYHPVASIEDGMISDRHVTKQ